MMTPSADNPIPRQSYSLSTLLLGMTGFSVWLVVLLSIPYVGVGTLFFLLPAIVRTISAVNARKRKGVPSSASMKINFLINSCIFCFGALLFLLFFSVVFTSSLLALTTLAGHYFENSPLWQLSIKWLSIVSFPIGFLLALIPPIKMLTLDWPREFDPVEDRFLTRNEIKDRRHWQEVANQSIVNSKEGEIFLDSHLVEVVE